MAANVLGLGIGSLIGGVLAQTTSPPLETPYWVYLALLVPLTAAVAWSRDSVAQPKSVTQVKLGVRVGVPPDRRTAFLAPGITTFVIFSLVGFYSALAPNLMAKTLAIHNHAVTGGLVFLLFAAATITVYATRRLGSRAVMLWGAGLMLPALALLVVAELAASLSAFVAGTVMGGLSLGAGYRGTLEVGNEIAPDDKRAELISMLFVCGNLGLAIPVIGIGVLAALTSPRLADLAFAGVIAFLSVSGLTFGLIKSQDRKQ